MGLNGNRIGVGHVTTIYIHKQTDWQMVRGMLATIETSRAILMERIIRYVSDNDLWNKFPPYHKETPGGSTKQRVFRHTFDQITHGAKVAKLSKVLFVGSAVAYVHDNELWNELPPHYERYG